MINAPESSSTRPYLIRALYEWCTDNGFTPYVAVAVDDRVQVPREYVKDGEIVLNIGLDATSALKLGNEFIEFMARFAGTAREIMVPVNQVMAIYARENGQGMAFSVEPGKDSKAKGDISLRPDTAVPRRETEGPELKVIPSTNVNVDSPQGGPEDEPEPPRPLAPGLRPTLKRVK